MNQIVELNIAEVQEVEGAVAPILYFGLAFAVTVAIAYYAS
jgi:hypothetical protein